MTRRFIYIYLYICVCVCVDTGVGIIYLDDDGGRASVSFFHSVRVSIVEKKRRKKKKGRRIVIKQEGKE